MEIRREIVSGKTGVKRGTLSRQGSLSSGVPLVWVTFLQCLLPKEN